MRRRSLLVGPAALAAAGAAPRNVAAAVPAADGTISAPDAYPSIDLRRFGADPSGAAPSDAALTSALAACGDNGATIRIPAGHYTFAHPINLASRRSIILEGEGATTGGAQAATRLTFTGAGSGTFINLNSARGCLLSRLQIAHGDPRFTGTYVSCVNDSGTDPAFCALLDCVVGSSAGAGTTHLNLDKCIQFTAERCNFLYGNPSVRGRLPGSYANVIRFRDCHWSVNHTAPVQGGGEAWTFDGCTFEGLLSGAAGGLYCSGPETAFNGLTVTGCWFGDATAGGAWLDMCANGALISGNFISGNKSAVTALALRKSVGVQICGNLFAVLAAAIDFVQPCQDIVVQGNICNTVGTGLRNADNVPTGSLVWAPNYGLGAPGNNHQRLGASGYAADAAAGVLRQWGTATAGRGGGTRVISFPIKFPTQCLNVVATLSGAGTVGSVAVSSLTAASFEASVQGAAEDSVLYWQALGS